MRRVLGWLFLGAGAIALVLTALSGAGLVWAIGHYPSEPEDTWALLVTTALTLGTALFSLRLSRWLRRAG